MGNEYLNPENEQLRQALFMLGNGLVEEADAEVSSFLKLHPSSGPAHRAKAMILCRRADFSGAEKSLLAAISGTIEVRGEYYFELGEILIHLGRTFEAVGRLSTAIQAMESASENWSLSSAFFSRAFAYFKLREYPAALKDLAKGSDGSIYYGGEFWDQSKLSSEIRSASQKRR